MSDRDNVVNLLKVACIPFVTEHPHVGVEEKDPGSYVVIQNDATDRRSHPIEPTVDACDEAPLEAWPGMMVVFHFAPSGRLLSVYATE